VGITAGSREVPGRNACDRRHPYRIIIIIIIILLLFEAARHRRAMQNVWKNIGDNPTHYCSM